jgi:hypothetical protein
MRPFQSTYNDTEGRPRMSETWYVNPSAPAPAACPGQIRFPTG